MIRKTLSFHTEQYIFKLRWNAQKNIDGFTELHQKMEI